MLCLVKMFKLANIDFFWAFKSSLIHCFLLTGVFFNPLKVNFDIVFVRSIIKKSNKKTFEKKKKMTNAVCQYQKIKLNFLTPIKKWIRLWEEALN